MMMPAKGSSPRQRCNPTRGPRPFVLVNMAMSADGKIATANRVVHSFGSARDQAHLYELRATADAILCGARTIAVEGAKLGNGGKRFTRLRLQRGLARYNLRVLVSGSGSIDPGAAIFRHRFSPIIVLTTEGIAARRLRLLRTLADEVNICGRDEIDLPAALCWLREKWQVRRLLCEGGGELNGALFRAGLVDELHLTVCPKVFGGALAPTIAGGHGAPTLAGAARFTLHSLRKVGDEAFLVFRRQEG